MNTRLRAALNHFKKKDRILFSIAKKVDIEPLEPRKPSEYFRSLCYEIMGQQLAKSPARIIFERFRMLYPSGRITPQYTLKLSEESIRGTGASWSKARFVRGLAQKVSDGTLDLKNILQMDDSRVVEELMKVKGIGPWTAQMFLMFTLGREDVFSHGDLGLRKAIIKLYSLSENAAKTEIEEIAKKWSPYRTYACRILWKSLEL